MRIKERFQNMFKQEVPEPVKFAPRELYEKKVKDSIREIEGLPLPAATLAGQYLYGKSENSYAARCLALLHGSKISETEEGFILKVPENLQHLSGGNHKLIHSEVGMSAWRGYAESLVEAYKSNDL